MFKPVVLWFSAKNLSGTEVIEQFMSVYIMKLKVLPLIKNYKVDIRLQFLSQRIFLKLAT